MTGLLEQALLAYQNRVGHSKDSQPASSIYKHTTGPGCLVCVSIYSGNYYLQVDRVHKGYTISMLNDITAREPQT